jgi:hypothetical protein
MAERVAKWAVRLFPRCCSAGPGFPAALGSGESQMWTHIHGCLPGKDLSRRRRQAISISNFRLKQRRAVRQSRVSLTQMAVRCGLRSDARIGPAPGAWLVILLLGICLGGSKAQWDELIHTGDCPLSSATGAVSTCLASSWTASSSCCMVSAEK